MQLEGCHLSRPGRWHKPLGCNPVPGLDLVLQDQSFVRPPVGRVCDHGDGSCGGGGTDLRLSSLVERARALDHELVLVPRKLLPAVEAIVRNASSALSDDARLRSTVLNHAQAALTRLDRLHPNAPELVRHNQTLRELANFQLGASELESIRGLAGQLMKLPNGPTTLSAMEKVSKRLRHLRNRIAHTLPETPRPAYLLDEEDENA